VGVPAPNALAGDAAALGANLGILPAAARALAAVFLAARRSPASSVNARYNQSRRSPPPLPADAALVERARRRAQEEDDAMLAHALDASLAPPTKGPLGARVRERWRAARPHTASEASEAAAFAHGESKGSGA
jgi:hypothetical protein